MQIIFDTIKHTFQASTDGDILGFGFIQDGALPVNLRPVSRFGFSIGGLSVTLPKMGQLCSSAQSIVHFQNLNLIPDTDYTLDYWVEMPADGTFTGQSTFKTAKPASPFASWIWNGTTKQWESPVPRPGTDYVWDEALLNWKPDPDIALRELTRTDAVTGARVAEDILDALITKGLIATTDLPQATIDRINERKTHRSHL
jgi:hypothetical protein